MDQMIFNWAIAAAGALVDANYAVTSLSEGDGYAA